MNLASRCSTFGWMIGCAGRLDLAERRDCGDYGGLLRNDRLSRRRTGAAPIVRIGAALAMRGYGSVNCQALRPWVAA
jgi:hypothetical protein